jgi:hypothetical protein
LRFPDQFAGPSVKTITKDKKYNKQMILFQADELDLPMIACGGFINGDAFAGRAIDVL